jgi:hypothetical protein
VAGCSTGSDAYNAGSLGQFGPTVSPGVRAYHVATDQNNEIWLWGGTYNRGELQLAMAL